MRRISLALTLLAGCQCSEVSGRAELVVFAASSLTDAFTELERGFELDHPGIDLVPVFAGSQALRLQIEQGAPADVFASANPRHMQVLVDAGRVEGVHSFARNALAVVIPATAPARRFEQLPELERIVVGAPEVPIGAYTEILMSRARERFGDAFADALHARIVSRESNVRLVLSKVELGEADAAVVYRTDVSRTTAVRLVEIPEGLAPFATYTVGRLVDAGPAATAFTDYLGSAASATVLRRHGFDVEARAP